MSYDAENIYESMVLDHTGKPFLFFKEAFGFTSSKTKDDTDKETPDTQEESKGVTKKSKTQRRKK